MAEHLVSRLAITGETMAEILAEAGGQNYRSDPIYTARRNISQSQQVSTSRSLVGVMLVPQRVPGIDAAAVLQQDYCDSRGWSWVAGRAGRYGAGNTDHRSGRR
ncbi:hypothetical protein [Nocardia sp. NPDC059239]|uniref:hypothetical protein n=1 Tax=unclassified Nocardia TaxID=2637762 RepID=UPI00369F868A